MDEEDIGWVVGAVVLGGVLLAGGGWLVTQVGSGRLAGSVVDLVGASTLDLALRIAIVVVSLAVAAVIGHRLLRWWLRRRRRRRDARRASLVADLRPLLGSGWSPEIGVRVRWRGLRLTRVVVDAHGVRPDEQWRADVAEVLTRHLGPLGRVTWPSPQPVGPVWQVWRRPGTTLVARALGRRPADGTGPAEASPDRADVATPTKLPAALADGGSVDPSDDVPSAGASSLHVRNGSDVPAPDSGSDARPESGRFTPTLDVGPDGGNGERTEEVEPVPVQPVPADSKD